MNHVLIGYAEVISMSFPKSAMTEFAHVARLPPSEFEQRYWELRVPYDRGQSPRDYWQAICGPDRPLDTDTLVTVNQIDVNGWLIINPVAVYWLQALNVAGIRLWLLSNAPHPLADAVERLDIAQYFDGMVFSARIGLAKPFEECFAAAASAMCAAVERILFFDDRAPNIEAASKYGMHTFHFTGEFPTLPTISVADGNPARHGTLVHPGK